MPTASKALHSECSRQPQHLSMVRSKDNDNDKATTAKILCCQFLWWFLQSRALSVGRCSCCCRGGWLWAAVSWIVTVAVVGCGLGCCGHWLWLLRSLIVAVAVALAALVVDCWFFAVNDRCCHGHWLLSSWMWLSRSLIVVGLLVNCWFHGGWFAFAVIYWQDKGRGKDNSIISCLFQQRVLVAVAEILTADMPGENKKIIYNQPACWLHFKK